jgi:hypothetical protein
MTERARPGIAAAATARVALALAVVAAAVLSAAGLAAAQEIGRIKTLKGAVHIERAGRREPALVGSGVAAADRVVTGPDGAVGITLADETLLSAGPDSVLVLDRFAFDAASGSGGLEASLPRGTLAVVSGRLAKHAPDAVRIRTPAALLGVRGTEFVVRASGAP